MNHFEPPERFNLTSYFLEDTVARGNADRLALTAIDRDGGVTEHTFGEIMHLQNRAAGAMLEHGLEPEDRVLLALGDGPEFVASWYGAVKAGGTVACVNPLLPPDDYLYYLQYSRAKIAVCDQDSLPGMLAALPQCRHLRALFVIGAAPLPDHAGTHVAVRSFAEVTATQSDHLDPADTHRDDVAVWLFTSGTTGKPKAAVHLQQDFVFNAERYAKDVMQLGTGDRTMAVSKLFFGYATGSNLLFPFAAGAQVVLFHGRSRPETVMEYAHRFRPTVLINVPTTINGMLNLENRERYDLSALRYMTSAGEALPEELYRRWIDAYGTEILDGIGSAEMFHVFISNRLGDVKLGTLGRIVPGYETRIVGPDGKDVADGEIGALWVKGRSTALCYHQARQKSRETFLGDWCVTADLFRKDAEGYYHYSGRGDDMLKVGGIWVSPLEIEDCLLKHPSVAECAVIGFTEEDLVKPKAFVVPKDGVTADSALASALQEHVRILLARYKYPRQVEFLAALPRNDRGKVDKNALRKHDAAAADPQGKVGTSAPETRE